MKCCFLFRSKIPAENLFKFLKNELKGEVRLTSYIGYPIIYVQEDEYETAIIKGSQYAKRYTLDCWWLDISQRRVIIPYVPVAYAEIYKEGKFEDGSWKKSTTDKIRALTKLASKALKREVIFEETPCKDVRFYIKRTDDMHEIHQTQRVMFSKVFATSVQNVIFKRAVLCDYFGKHIIQMKDVEEIGEDN